MEIALLDFAIEQIRLGLVKWANFQFQN
jgi:hypothetical protein